MARLTEEQIANRAKWCEALRSGKYTQNKGCLARKNPTTGETSYCCLGVAALSLGYTLSLDDLTPSSDKILSCHSGGLNEKEKYLLGIEHQVSLIDANDTYDKTFLEIADMIDADTSGTKLSFGKPVHPENLII